MAARAKFDSDAPYLTHPRAAVIYYEPFPAHLLSQLARLARLLRHAPNAAEAAWLEAQMDTLTREGACCPPVAVRKVANTRRERRPRHEIRYGLRGFGPRNKSGRARS